MRNTIVLEKDWTFYKNPQSESGEAVTLPHTWNAVDGQDGGNFRNFPQRRAENGKFRGCPGLSSGKIPGPGRL